jgi:hypothetical protein
MEKSSFPAGIKDMLEFGLIEALLGRRSRRFFMGAPRSRAGFLPTNHGTTTYRR